MTDLQGKRALVTGGGSGAGATIATVLAEAGAVVTICGRREQPLQAVAAQHFNIDYRLCDISVEAEVIELFDDMGTVDIAIANAGTAVSKPFERTTMADWQAMIGTNLTGVFLTWREARKRMPEDWGRLISIASTAGLKGYAYTAAYSAAKHGVVGLARAVAKDVANTGITANALCPSFLDTPMTDASIVKISAVTGMDRASARQELSKHNPQNRLITAEEVAAAVLWICAETSSGINGQALPIAGGEL